jgi:hypothetical protein
MNASAKSPSIANETPSFSTVPTRNPIHAPTPTFAAR